ncbi:MAG: zinc ribbon domain-containing protein [Solirubrobacteraceae bacterium]
MKGPLHVIRRRRTERPANGVETAQAATEAPTQAQPTAGLASTPPPPAADQPPPAADQPAPAAGDASAAPLTAEQQPAAEVPAGQEPVPARPSFRQRGRLRRRLRYLRRVRELGFRDLGGLVFDQHRFSQANEALVHGKFSALAAVDGELRALEHALDDRRSLTELREPGVSVCSRCGALHGSEARFCPSCGTPVRGPLAIADVGEAVSLPAGEPHAAGPTPAPPLPQPLTPVALQLQPLAPTPEPAAPEQPAEPVAPEPPAPGEQPTEVIPPVDEDAPHPPAGGEAQQPVAHRSGERGEP